MYIYIYIYVIYMKTWKKTTTVTLNVFWFLFQVGTFHKTMWLQWENPTKVLPGDRRLAAYGRAATQLQVQLDRGVL